MRLKGKAIQLLILLGLVIHLVRRWSRRERRGDDTGSWAADVPPRQELSEVSQQAAAAAFPPLPFDVSSPPGPPTGNTRGIKPEYLRHFARRPVQVEEGSMEDIHLIITTDCRPFQQWQIFVLLYSAREVGQTSHITQIASGCEDDEEKKNAFRSYTDSTFHVHFAPTYNEIQGDFYPPYNRPNGIRHWLQHMERRLTETIIVVLDPDQMFVRKLELTGKVEDSLPHVSAPANAWEQPSEMVVEGRPVGQVYGIGASWLHRLRLNEFVPPGSPALETNDREATDYFSVGPPWMLHRNDVARMVDQWADWCPPIRNQDKDLLAEMWAYSSAAAHHGLKHQQMKHYMTSDVRTGPGSIWGEAWPWIDKWMDEGAVSEKGTCVPPGKHKPVVIHYCQGYGVGDEWGGWNFHKGRSPPDIMNCDSPLLKEPPKGLMKQIMTDKEADLSTRRSAFMLCNLIPSINRIMIKYRERFCPAGFNRQRLLRLSPAQPLRYPDPDGPNPPDWDDGT